MPNGVTDFDMKVSKIGGWWHHALEFEKKGGGKCSNSKFVWQGTVVYEGKKEQDLVYRVHAQLQFWEISIPEPQGIAGS